MSEDKDKPSEETRLLTCPIRGKLSVSTLAKDGVTPSEEARRIDFIKFLMKRGYPKERIAVETVVIKKLGEKGRNKLRADVIVYDRNKNQIKDDDPKERLGKAIIVAEIKRDSKSKASGIENQLEPALYQMPRLDALGVYWDDINRIVFAKKIEKVDDADTITVVQDDIANLPKYGVAYKAEPITVDKLAPPTNLVSLLFGLANIMRSHGINDESLRYRETVKLILARYCDEREAQSSKSGELSLQVLPGGDHDFESRVSACYAVAAKRYSRAQSLFSPTPESELPERTQREIIKHIQGVNFSEASNETMQQVFMSFVPTVFKKALDQYFTPIGLIETMVAMMNIGPNDTILDPAMGTADFLTTAMDQRMRAGDADILQRIFGADCDQKAYDLAVINMILNKDGQSNLECVDTIKEHQKWPQNIDVALCNPPFGEKSIENRSDVLANYDLGHIWEQNDDGSWTQTDQLLKSQQLGILFIERCWKSLSNNGRLAIILPEGYLCTRSYGYVRQWICDNTRILGIVELPRRIFTKSNADLRGNIVVLQKVSPEELKDLKNRDYPIFADIVRKVGFKMGAGFAPIVARDPKTGLEIRDEQNEPLIDSDFLGVQERFEDFAFKIKHTQPLNLQPNGFSSWKGARISDVADHPEIDIKPRRLSVRALANIRELKASEHIRLGEIADVIDTKVDLMNDPSAMWRLIEGLDIRAVEGLVTPQYPAPAWEIADRKQRHAYKASYQDIIVGLVRPERRNIGLLLDEGDDVIGSPDGVAVVRVKEKFKDAFPQLWIFQSLRLEATRLQLWTESGGTSYGKLTSEHIQNVILKKPKAEEIQAQTSVAEKWAKALEQANQEYCKIGGERDRYPIINSPMFGLEPVEDPWGEY